MQVDLLLVDAVHRMYIMRASVDQRIRYPSRYKDDERFYTGDRAATLPRQCDAARDPLNEKKTLREHHIHQRLFPLRENMHGKRAQ
jgi:hypothetical protein